MSDLLQVADLERAKLHDTFHSEVITGKAGGLAGGADIDFTTNAVTGQVQATLPKILSQVGFVPANFDFSTGGTLSITDRNKAIFYETDGNWYSWGGTLPKTIPPASSPASTGGIAVNAWNISTSAFMYLDWDGFTAALLAEADIIDDSIPDSVGNSQRVEAIVRLLSNTPKNALASGIPMDGSVRTTEINAVLSAGKDLYLPTGSVKASGLVPLNSTHIIGDGTTNSVLSPSTPNTNVMNFNNGQADTLIKDMWFEGLGYPSATIENGIVHDGTQNCRRNSTENSRFNGFSGAALRFSAGWGNRLKQVNINSCLIGLDFKVSPLLAGWSGSGFLSDSSYIATCGTGVRTEAIWNMTMLNTIIEDCDLPINQTQGATPQVWINTWFESNKQSPRLTQSTIFIGGRLEGGEDPVTPFYGNMALPAFPFDYECITEVSYGISIFRDVNAQVFKADGQGIKFFKPHASLGWDVLDVAGSTAKKLSVGRGANAIAGGITSETWGNDGGSWVDITKLVGRRHFNSFQVDTMNEYGVKVQGQGSSSAGGTGFTQVVISTGRQVGSGGGATEGGERWAWNENGHYSPASDAKFDIGFSASFRVRDMRIVNAPIVGSDYRIKKTPRSMSQELLDFALSVELKHFEFKDGTRSHSGIIITEEFLSSLDKVMSLDSCAAFCRDIFTDAEGNPVTKIIHGVELGDLWQVRQDEWQNILLEALRRKAVAA